LSIRWKGGEEQLSRERYILKKDCDEKEARKGDTKFGNVEAIKTYFKGGGNEKNIGVSNMFCVYGSGKHFCPNRNKCTFKKTYI
jgi:hypothetical protein